MDCYRFILAATMLILGLMAQSGVGSAEESQNSDPSGVLDVVSLSDLEVTESSGLAVSWRRDGHFWTHNDSGGKPRLYAFDSGGQKSGHLDLDSVPSGDWEDMASFVDEGTPRLLVADCGDNLATRRSVKLYLLDEPDPIESGTCDRIQTLTIVYPDGPRDCEAVAVDCDRRQIVMIAKSVLPVCGVYVVALPSRVAGRTKKRVTATRVGTITMPMVTAMDIDPKTGDLWLTNYFQAFRFPRAQRDAPIGQQISVVPTTRELPRWRQIESIAIDRVGDLWITSEGTPAPLGRLPAMDDKP